MTHTSRTLRTISSGSVAGIVAAGAYMLEQAADLRLFGYPTDDRLLLGRLVLDDNDEARTAGLAMHFLNGAVAGTAYSLIAEPLLPGSPVARGLTFSLAETCALFPFATLGHLHPAIKDGTLAPYWSKAGFAQQILRHTAFGAVLGPVAACLLRR